MSVHYFVFCLHSEDLSEGLYSYELHKAHSFTLTGKSYFSNSVHISSSGFIFLYCSKILASVEDVQNFLI